MLDEIMQVFRDPFFWIGVGLFVFSILGIIWILKTFQKEPAESSLLIEEKAKIKKAPITMEELSGRLEKIENILSELAPKIGQPQEKNELADELHAISQTLKVQEGSRDPKELRELRDKLDKIYQVLVSLSAPEGK